MHRSAFLAAGSAGAFTLASRTPLRAADAFRMIVTETEVPLVPNSVAWLAQSMGYFNRVGVDVELVKVQQTPSAVAALRAGEGDAANVSTDVALQLLGREQMDVRGVISPDKAIPFVILTKKGIASPRDLIGKTFGVARVGSVDYETSRAVLVKYGVDPDKLQYLAIGQPPVRLQSLLAGQIDATAVSVGIVQTIADKSGVNVLVSQPDFFRAAPFVSKVTVVPTTLGKARPKVVEGVVRGMILAARDFARKPNLWVDAMAAARPDVKRGELEALAAAYRSQWSVNGGLNLDAVKFTTTALYRSADFKDVKPVPPAAWIDTSYVDRVLRTIGVDRSADDPGR